ncbi:hypothetical protein AB9F45_35645, partial [Rhizobium leguminosarum]
MRDCEDLNVLFGQAQRFYQRQELIVVGGYRRSSKLLSLQIIQAFDIPERSFVVALGASGCGKST